MKTKIINIYEKLSASYWFIPSVMAILALLTSSLLVYLDRLNQQRELIDLTWISLTGAAGARAILSTVSSSMITVTGIVFSITIVTLSLASQQFGPRLLQNFMRDRGNQLVLGTVTSTYLYCLVALRTVSEDPASYFVPHLSILVAVLLGVLCVGVLIYFIHHIAESIQVTNVIARVSLDLAGGIERLFPEKAGEVPGHRQADIVPVELPPDFAAGVRPLRALVSGYLQAVDQTGLLALAESRDLVIRIGHRPGHFVVAGAPLVEIWPGEAAGSRDLTKEVNSCFITGHRRSSEQDVEFLINELVEIAVRALSPGINDPFTAISCVDHLGAALCRLAERNTPVPLVRDASNRVRLLITPPAFDRLVDASFDQIRQYSVHHASVSIRLLEAIRMIIPFTRSVEQRDALVRQAAMIENGGRNGLAEENDRRDLHERYLAVFQALEENFGLTSEG